MKKVIMLILMLSCFCMFAKKVKVIETPHLEPEFFYAEIVKGKSFKKVKKELKRQVVAFTLKLNRSRDMIIIKRDYCKLHKKKNFWIYVIWFHKFSKRDYKIWCKQRKVEDKFKNHF